MQTLPICIPILSWMQTRPGYNPPGCRPPPDADPPGCKPPDADPLDTDPPDAEPPGPLTSDTCWEANPPLQKEWHTLVKTLPSRNYCCARNKHNRRHERKVVVDIYVSFVLLVIYSQLDLIIHFISSQTLVWVVFWTVTELCVRSADLPPTPLRKSLRDNLTRAPWIYGVCK